jgi:transcriptional regulator with XRE-family HTH domain
MDLAVASGYSVRYVGDIERGAKSATMRTMHDLATLMDSKLSALVIEAESLLETDFNARKCSVKFKRGSQILQVRSYESLQIEIRFRASLR